MIKPSYKQLFYIIVNPPHLPLHHFAYNCLDKFYFFQLTKFAIIMFTKNT